LLVALSSQRQNGQVILNNFLNGLHGQHSASYADQSRQSEVELAITEAWNWLEVQGLLVPAGGINGSSGWRRSSRRAEKMTSSEDVKEFARSRRIEKDRLHPKIAQSVWSAFLRGEYDVAVFKQ